MRVLIACEESQRVTIAFRERGHEAYSNDILPCSGGHPEWHIQADIRTVAVSKGDIITFGHDGHKWDLIISFPPCTDLSLSGARWFDKKRLSGEQEESIKFFLAMWEISNSTENPMNIMQGWTYLKKWFPHIVEWMKEHHFPIKPTQIIKPSQFGHMEQKKTCLWLKGVTSLTATNNVEEEMMKLPYAERAKVHHASPGPERAKLRSKTYPGIAQAMAMQWG